MPFRLLMQICPSLENAAVVKNSGSVNAEEIMSRNTDLMIINSGVYESEAERAKIEAIGAPYIVIDFETIEDQLKAVNSGATSDKITNYAANIQKNSCRSSQKRTKYPKMLQRMDLFHTFVPENV